jgi:hypothetical protein
MSWASGMITTPPYWGVSLAVVVECLVVPDGEVVRGVIDFGVVVVVSAAHEAKTRIVETMKENNTTHFFIQSLRIFVPLYCSWFNLES